MGSDSTRCGAQRVHVAILTWRCVSSLGSRFCEISLVSSLPHMLNSILCAAVTLDSGTAIDTAHSDTQVAASSADERMSLAAVCVKKSRMVCEAVQPSFLVHY